jgi:hypothetical protein
LAFEIWNAHKWWPKFSRAVRTLEARGLIEFPNLVPAQDNGTPIDPYGNSSLLRLSDGVYLNSSKNNQQRRFGRVLSEKAEILNAYQMGQELLAKIKRAEDESKQRAEKSAERLSRPRTGSDSQRLESAV